MYIRIRKITIALACTTILGASSAAMAGGSATWSYLGSTGPENWGSLAADWAVCESGRYQSPINIEGGIETDLGNVDASIKSTPLKFGLDGPTFAVEYESGSMLTINDTNYELQQFHFHHTSEHTVNGKSFPMEAHLVLKAEGAPHANAVLGVFFVPGAENAMLDQFWGVLPRSAKKDTSGISVNVGDLLPEDTRHYSYEGSMTTPGCIQSVRWFVLEQPVQASQAQIDAFIVDLTEGKTNNRPIQKLYGRSILKGN